MAAGRLAFIGRRGHSRTQFAGLLPFAIRVVLAVRFQGSLEHACTVLRPCRPVRARAIEMERRKSDMF